MQSSTFTFASESDSLPIFVRVWAPSAAARATLQIVHGMAEHSARYERVAKAFVDAGYAVYASDHRGHGQSVPPGVEPGHMADQDGWNKAVADVDTLARRIERDHPGIPHLLLAHSMGSFMAQQLLWQAPERFTAVVLSGSNGKPPAIAAVGRLVARVERWRHGAAGKSQLLHKLSFGDFNKRFRPARTDLDWLSRDPAEVDKYVADPLCGFVVSASLWVDLLDALGPLTAPANLARMRKEKPLYLLAGCEDPVGDFGRGVERLAEAYRAAGVRNVTVKLYPGARHETLNETNKDEVTRDLLAFADSVVSG